MKFKIALLLIFPWFVFSQTEDSLNIGEDYEYIIIEGDSIPRLFVDLDEVKLLPKLKLNTKAERKQYLILRRKTLKVYPYAKLAADRLQQMNEKLKSIKKKSHRKRYIKRMQKYIEDEFSEELKKLTRTEGQILIKLIHRQTGITTFDLIKDLRSGWNAFWYNNTAALFNISLKREFKPLDVKEDYFIEDILQRAFQSGKLAKQSSVLEFDYYEASRKWKSAK